MGKIENMQKDQDNFNIKYVKKVHDQVPKRTVNSPQTSRNSHRYHLDPKQKKARLVIPLAIAGMAALLGIGNVSFASNSKEPVTIQDIQVQSETDQNTLNKEDVLAYAENKLLLIAYQDRLSSMDRARIEYGKHDDFNNIDSLKIVEDIESVRVESIEQFSYIQFNNLIDQIGKSTGNAKEIDQYLALMIEINNNADPSQEKLEELNKATSKLLPLDFKLENNKFVIAREKGMEID